MAGMASGGGHGLLVPRCGACDESAGSHLAGHRWKADLGAGRRHPGLQSAHDPAPAPAAAVLRLRRSAGSAAAAPVAQTGARRRGAAPAGPLSRALSGFQHPAFSPAGPPRARRALLLRLREEGPADRWPGGQAPAPRPPSPPQEPRPCFGELLHLDGSRHRWLALRPESWFTLIAVVDDATKRLLYAALQDRLVNELRVAGVTTAIRYGGRCLGRYDPTGHPLRAACAHVVHRAA